METARIQLLMHHQTNRHLLEQWLSSHYDVTTKPVLDKSVHLVILDDLSLADYEASLYELKQELTPIFLPVLLITNQVKLQLNSLDLWQRIDDLLTIPVDRGLLAANIKVLLRTRELSITKQEQSEALKRLRRAIESASDAIILLDEPQILYINPSAEKMFGYSADELEKLEDYISEIDNDDAGLKASIKEAQAKGWRGELQLRDRDRSDIAVYVRIDNMPTDASTTGLVLTCTDITKQKETQASEREQRLLAEVLRDTATILTSTLDIQEVFERILANLARLIPHQASSIMLVENGYALIVQSHGYPQTILQEAMALFDGASITAIPYLNTMVATKEAIIVDDLSQLAVPHLQTSQSYVAAPIMFGGNIIGFINVERQEASDEGDTVRLQAIADQAAVAIQNARLYARAQSAAIYEERQRLARDFHDSVSQALFSASVIVEAIQRSLPADEETQVNQLISELHLLTRGALAETRTLLLELKPTKLLETDLSELLKQLAEALWSRKQLDIVTDLTETTAPPLRVKVAFYRIAQEALHNILKHADAERVTVRYRGSTLLATLEVEDDGNGFEFNEQRAGLGLSNMRERAQSIDADFAINTSIGKGTIVILRWNSLGQKQDDE